jgi:preprotein translocase subunit SecA
VSDSLLRPGVVLGPYPERLDPRPGWLDRAALGLARSLRRRERSASRLREIAAHVGRESGNLRGRSEAELRETLAELRGELRRHGLQQGPVIRAFGLVREVARRTLGMEHFDVQVIGGYVMLNGMLAEMDTGEGKTLTATLPACTAALAGIPVHVISVNDYLVERDAGLMGPVYQALGLSVGTVCEKEADPEARRRAYGCDVTYVSNKQVAFDYLRDRLVRGSRRDSRSLVLSDLIAPGGRAQKLVLRGLCFGIVDEADSVLIDEARTPLILTRRSDSSDLEETCRTALALADRLKKGEDFEVHRSEREIRLSERGIGRLEDLAGDLGGLWAGARRREELVQQALAARLLFVRDDHYLVRDGKVQIIDANTGRVMPDRSWEGGLHQMIECKEGCEVSGQRETLARISYQQFYRRYLRLCGMTGTAREVAREIASVYGLRTVAVPPRLRRRRKCLGERIYPTAAARWDAVVERIEELHRSGRPVLVGTRSVAASEHLSGLLDERGLPHCVLNARQDAREAEIVERAGERGRITVATNMAGRGADIRLGPGVEELGGLHVIAVGRSEARRIDRQLFGRCGRQGDPGSYETLASLEDEVAIDHAPEPLRAFAQGLGGRAAPWVRRTLISCAQRAVERRHARRRRELLGVEEYLENALAFAGPAE